MVVFTTMEQDQIMGAVYVSTVTASIEVMKLKDPLIGSWPPGATIVELTQEDLAEDHP